MSTFEGAFAITAALAVVVGIFLYAVLALGWRALHEQARLRLGRVLTRHGASLALSGHQGAVATRRCVACGNKAECGDWLRSGARGGIDKFCPNAAFITRVSRRPNA